MPLKVTKSSTRCLFIYLFMTEMEVSQTVSNRHGGKGKHQALKVREIIQTVGLNDLRSLTEVEKQMNDD